MAFAFLRSVPLAILCNKVGRGRLMATRTFNKIALQVHEIDREDIFLDSVRVHYSHRPGIRSGRLFRVTAVANGKSIFAIARNTLQNDREGIWLDDELRKKLGRLREGNVTLFEFTKASSLREIVWLWNASNPANRIPGRLGVVSFGLGIVGLLLGAWSVYLAFRSPI
jgi:hypothetical protein